jgi:hypothetical protein
MRVIERLLASDIALRLGKTNKRVTAGSVHMAVCGNERTRSLW